MYNKHINNIQLTGAQFQKFKVMTAFDSEKAYTFKSMVATKKNFKEMLRLKPQILHISCHGVTKSDG